MKLLAAIAALDGLDVLGVRTAVVTNKREDMARKLLGALGLAERMATIPQKEKARSVR